MVQLIVIKLIQRKQVPTMLNTANATKYHAIMQWLHFNLYDITVPMINARMQDFPHAPESIKVPVQTSAYSKEDLIDACDGFINDIYYEQDEQKQARYEQLLSDDMQDEVYNPNQNTDIELMQIIANRLNDFGDQRFYLIKPDALKELYAFAEEKDVALGDVLLIPGDGKDLKSLHLTMMPKTLIDMLYKVGEQTAFDLEQVIIALDDIFFDAKYPSKIKINELLFDQFVNEVLIKKVTK